MKDDSLPQDLSQYLLARLAAVHANARLVFVFDPAAHLGLGPSLPVAGRLWHVVRYDGNDLALRAGLARLADSAGAMLIWVVARSDPAGSLRLTSLVDLLARADDWFDLSLAGVLRELVPGETWPVEALEQFAAILAADLPAVVEGHHHLRRYLEPGTALDVHAVRLLALHVLQPSIPLPDLIFRRDTPAQALDRYTRLVWRDAWTPAGRELLRQHARLSPPVALGEVVAWFDVPPEQIAVYIYVRRFLSSARLPNIANQLRGLGLLGFDPEPLEPWVDSRNPPGVDRVLALWEQDVAWRQQVILQAETMLSWADVRRVVGLLRADDLWRAVALAETPALVAGLLSQLLRVTGGRDLDAVIAQWPAHRPHAAGHLPVTAHSPAAQALTGLLDETATVLDRLSRAVAPQPDLAGIVDWYVGGGFYDLEFACARAGQHLRTLPDQDLIAPLSSYLQDLRQRVRDFLEAADQALARCIDASWKQYLDHPRLATHIVYDLVKKRRVQPTAEASIFIVIFDGMRWDSWQRLIKPRLLQLFELKEPEKAYLSLLPSWTFVARTSILAGQPPQRWAPMRDGGIITNPKVLAGKLFDIPASETDRRLRFVSRMEIDRTYMQLDTGDRFPWNVVIFNVSDDNLHQERGNLLNLNDKIAVLLDDIVRTLDSLVKPQDTVILTSDHGFMELDEADGLVIREEARWQRVMSQQDDPVRFRYLAGMEHPAGFVVQHPGLRESPFTVAVGRRWFRRADDRRPPDRYAHGGLSLAEMVVPGVVLRRIVHRRIEVVLEEPPVRLEALEGTALVCDVMVANRGNQPTRYRLEVKADTDAMPQVFEGELAPGAQHRVQPVVQPVYRAGGSTGYVGLVLSYDDAAGKRQRRRHEIQVIVKPRTDVVELQFGGLDELDGLG